jgi:glycosyltransferase involved in cell wall biosynthesis
MYVKRAVIDAIGPLDAGFPMAFEDVDYCLRARLAGYRTLYCPRAVLTHLEGHTRGERKELREIVAQERFWERWGDHFDARRVWRESPERLRIVYVLQDTGVAGGHRVIFEQMNRLAARGHEVELFSLATSPKWFRLEVPVRTFASLEALSEALSAEEAIKVATWWETGELVWRASLLRGVPVFLAQDLETSYYEGDGEATAALKARVLASYRKEFHFLTDATWTQRQLRELGLEARVVAPGIDARTFRPAGGPPEPGVVLSLGRSHALKNADLLFRAFAQLGDRAALWLFGVEPHVGREAGARYFYCPSDAQVAGLYQRASVFALTSIHEGFGLPILEAMACGCPVVCTDADGNMDFCRDGENCLIVPKDDERALARTLERLLGDRDLRERLRQGGLATTGRYTWDAATDRLEAFYRDVARGQAGP